MNLFSLLLGVAIGVLGSYIVRKIKESQETPIINSGGGDSNKPNSDVEVK